MVSARGVSYAFSSLMMLAGIWVAAVEMEKVGRDGGGVEARGTEVTFWAVDSLPCLIASFIAICAMSLSSINSPIVSIKNYLNSRNLDLV
jgi:hypothetical protein